MAQSPGVAAVRQKALPSRQPWVLPFSHQLAQQLQPTAPHTTDQA